MDKKHKSDIIYNEQVQLLYTALPFSIAASLINGGILVYIERSVINHQVLSIWLFCLVLVSVLRSISYIMYKRSYFWPVNSPQWGQLYTYFVILVSLIWGGASLLLFSAESIEHQAFLCFVIAGMSAGAISTLAYIRHTALIFVACVLLPLASQFFLNGTEFGYAMGVMILLYFLLMIIVVNKNYHNTFQNIELRLRAEEQKKALIEGERNYQKIFESAPLGILHYTPQGEITSKNNMALDLMDVNDEYLSQVNLLNRIKDSDFTNAIKASLNGELGQYKGSTKVISLLSDKAIRMYCRGTYDSMGEISGGVAILEDISEESRIDQMKNEFVSTVSHELRTPITAIFGSIELMRNAKSSLGTAQFESLVDNVSRNSERLLHLVNDILDVEKIMAGKMDFHLEVVVLADLLQQSVVDNQSYAEKYKVEFVLHPSTGDINLLVDKNRFQQVMANLLSNAAKFSPANAIVEVGTNVENEMVRVFVKDNGPGIKREFQGKIFEKFTQSDASDTRKVGGTGLGLSISKEIVERMNGHLSYETELGEGSVFYFEFPIIEYEKE